MVEGSGFENRRTRKGTRGSNPFSSAECIPSSLARMTGRAVARERLSGVVASFSVRGREDAKPLWDPVRVGAALRIATDEDRLARCRGLVGHDRGQGVLHGIAGGLVLALLTRSEEPPLDLSQLPVDR